MGLILIGKFWFWKLIMNKAPEGYFEEDLDNHKRLIEKTNAIEMPHITSPNDRPKGTTKWKFLKEIGLVRGAENEVEEKRQEGTGIQFLSGDVNGLIRQLRLLLGEYCAGNKSSTRNKIVAILDQLLRRNYLNQKEYNAVGRTVSC